MLFAQSPSRTCAPSARRIPPAPPLKPPVHELKISNSARILVFRLANHPNLLQMRQSRNRNSPVSHPDAHTPGHPDSHTSCRAIRATPAPNTKPPKAQRSHRKTILALSRPRFRPKTPTHFLTALPSYDPVAFHWAHARNFRTTENSQPVRT